jgi:hypothetical protein
VTAVTRYALLCALLSLPTLAAAKDSKTSTTAAARAFAKGSDLFNKRDFVGAIEAFEEAYRLRPHFMVQCNIARSYEWSGNVVQAAVRYRRCLKEGATGSEMGAKAEQALKDVERRITWVQVDSPGAGGTIYVDGRASGITPRRVPVNPGAHVVEVRRANATPASSTVQTRGGEQRSVSLVPVELTPIVRENPPSSQPSSSSRRRVHRAWFWATAATTVALAAAATGLGIATLKARSSYEEHPTEDGYQTAINRRLLTNVFWGLAGAAAVSSTVLFFYTDFSGERRAPAVTSLSVGVRGTF